MSELICAVATPGRPCAIGIVRLSGTGAVSAVDALFTPKAGGTLAEYPAGRLVLGTIRDEAGGLLDEIQVVRYRAGYTGEESAELFCHGSPVVLSLVMEALCAVGARPAGPGEFTRRAFLNGKMGLTQAEAVMDLIDAETPTAARNAAGQLTGGLARRAEEIYDRLVELSARFCAVLDYPDEDLDPFTVEEMAGTLSTVRGDLEALLATYRRGRALTAGVPCAIVGRPNAGKSSLLNALVGYERAIVTDIPGTTRDTIEERCQLGGVLLRLIDTAGLRETRDRVEALGVERSRAAMEGAELILVLWDASAPVSGEDTALLERAAACAPTILVRTKCDLPAVAEVPGSLPAGVTVVETSSRTGTGLPALEKAVGELYADTVQETGSLLTNQRQADAARRGLEAVERALEGLSSGLTPDAALSDTEQAMAALGELTGHNVTGDVTDRIFSRFCVGK